MTLLENKLYLTQSTSSTQSWNISRDSVSLLSLYVASSSASMVQIKIKEDSGSLHVLYVASSSASMVQIKEVIFQKLWSDSQNHQREVVGVGEMEHVRAGYETRVVVTHVAIATS